MADLSEDRREQMYPHLSAVQVRRISALGERRDVKAGEILFDAGDRDMSFFVVVTGAIEISRPVGDQQEVVTRHGPGQFTGEINMLSGRRSLVRARVFED